MSRKKYILYMRWISVEILLTFRKVKVGKSSPKKEIGIQKNKKPPFDLEVSVI
jgi:hypothetical protein